MDTLNMLRALARYQTHGGYTFAAVMADGDCICTRCVRDNYRQVFRDTRDRTDYAWQCVGLANSGETDEAEFCGPCGNLIWDGKL